MVQKVDAASLSLNFTSLPPTPHLLFLNVHWDVEEFWGVTEKAESYIFKVVIHIAKLKIGDDSDDEISPLSIFHAVGGRVRTQGDTL